MNRVFFIAVAGLVSLFWIADGFGQNKETTTNQNYKTTDLNDAENASLGFDDIIAKRKTG